MDVYKVSNQNKLDVINNTSFETEKEIQNEGSCDHGGRRRFWVHTFPLKGGLYFPVKGACPLTPAPAGGGVWYTFGPF